MAQTRCSIKKTAKMEEKRISDQVVQYIIKMSHEEFSSLTVGKLAQELGIDRTKMSKQFKRERNIKLETFLFQQRMGRAAVLLTSRKGITVKEVSETVGFGTVDYFIKKFKEHFGIVPGKFRQLRKRKNKKNNRRKSEPEQVNCLDEGNPAKRNCDTCKFKMDYERRKILPKNIKNSKK